MTSESEVDAQARKRNLLDALYRKYQRSLARALFRRRLDREEVADILQETWCRIQDRADVESIEYPRAFLFRVAHNLAHNVRKHQQIAFPHGPVDVDSLDVAAAEPSIQRVLEAQQELAIVRRAFQELSPKCRRVFVMSRFDCLSYPQIARELNISISMVEKYISQALAHLRTRVTEATTIPRALSIAEAE